jgi:hypothetical protein
MRLASSLLLALGLSASWAMACGPSVLIKGGGSGDGGSGGATATTVTTGTAGAGGTSTTTTVGPGGSGGEGGECMSTVLALEPEYRPVDAIFLADNSFQMGTSLSELALHLYPAFVNTLDQLNLDIQVIVLSDHGAGPTEICVGPPLSQTTNCAGPPQGVPGRFQHYSTPLQFGDPLCKTLDSLVGTVSDEFNLAPGGWQSWLRGGTLKALIPFTRGGVNCTWGNTTFQDLDQSQPGQQVATSWDAALRNLAPQHFGTINDRNYVLHSFVGIAPKPGDSPFLHTEPLQTTTCYTQVGTGYQWLSIGTESTRSSICSEQSYSNMLVELAFQIAAQAQDPCAYTLPNPPGDLGRAALVYTPPNSSAQTFVSVDSAQLCMPAAYYWETSDTLRLCPQACTVITSQGGTIEAELRCPPVGP